MTWFNDIQDWIGSHWTYIAIAGLLGYFIYTFFFKDKKHWKQVNRAEVERKNFINRMKNNYSSYNYLYRGPKLIGRVDKMRMTIVPEFDDKGNPLISKNIKPEEAKEKSVMEMVITPIFLSLGPVKIPALWEKKMCIMSGINSMTRDTVLKELIVLETVTYDYYLGIYYDRDYKEKIVPYIVADSQFRTDWDKMSEVYYGKSQEQATFDPDRALEVHKKQIELEIAKEQRAKAITGNN